MRTLKLRIVALALILSVVTPSLTLLLNRPANAAQLTNRSIHVSTAQPSLIGTYTIDFTYATISPIGSLAFSFCDSPVFDYPCNAPAGIDVTGASISSQSGNTGFSVDGANTTSNRLVLTRVSAVAAAVASQYVISNVTNPSTPGLTTYVRIFTYASTDGTGAHTDNGAVAYAMNAPLSIGAAVPPFLQLCVALTVAQDCSTASGDSISLGFLSRTQTKTGTSQFAIGTNSITGYVVFGLGTTMTSGNNAIPAIGSPSPSIIGNSQFGINLRDNSIPNVGSDPSGSGTGAPTANYNTPNLYMFNNGDSITASTLPTNYNRLTVAHIVNISSSQPAGVYSTTITYMGVANF